MTDVLVTVERVADVVFNALVGPGDAGMRKEKMVRLFRAKEQADARIVIDIVIRRLAGNGFARGAKEPHRRGVVWFASQDHVGEPLPIYVDGT